jgi:trigger factor
MEPVIKNILNKNLKKEYQITLPKQLLDSKVNNYIDSIKGTYNLKGFRKGQVPALVIKEKHGKAIFIDEAEKLISENIKKIIEDNKLKLATQPAVDFKSIDAENDFVATLTFEIFPEIPEIDLNKIKVTKREIQIEESEIQEELNKFAKYFCEWEKQDIGYKAKLKDAVKIDYVGKVDKVEFEGGSAQNYQLELGSKSFIDDFEEQLVGKKAGDELVVKVKFPKEYHAPNLAGKSAEFAVKIHEVLVEKLPNIDDNFLKEKFGFESKKILEDNLRKELEKRNHDISIDAFKIELLEFFNKKYDFELPQGIVDAQTTAMWEKVEDELKTNPQKFKNDKEKEKARLEKEVLASKIIRCSMILGKIGADNKIEVSKEEFDKEISKALAKFPGQEKQVIEFYQKNPKAVQNLRDTLLELKTLDFITKNESIEKKNISFKDFEKFYEKLTKDIE